MSSAEDGAIGGEDNDLAGGGVEVDAAEDAGAADVGLALVAYGLLVFGRVSPVVVVALSVLVGSLWLT